jgi:hypothetical protein
MQCEYCGGPINAKPKVLELQTFSDFSVALTARAITGKNMQAEYSQ